MVQAGLVVLCNSQVSHIKIIIFQPTSEEHKRCLNLKYLNIMGIRRQTSQEMNSGTQLRSEQTVQIVDGSVTCKAANPSTHELHGKIIEDHFTYDTCVEKVWKSSKSQVR